MLKQCKMVSELKNNAMMLNKKLSWWKLKWLLLRMKNVFKPLLKKSRMEKFLSLPEETKLPGMLKILSETLIPLIKKFLRLKNLRHKIPPWWPPPKKKSKKSKKILALLLMKLHLLLIAVWDLHLKILLKLLILVIKSWMGNKSKI